MRMRSLQRQDTLHDGRIMLLRSFPQRCSVSRLPNVPQIPSSPPSCARLNARGQREVCASSSQDASFEGREAEESGPQPPENGAAAEPPRRGSILDKQESSAGPAWRTGFELVRHTGHLVWANAWTVLAIFAACDGLVFVLHRFCHRLTNEVALRFLLDRSRAHELLTGNLWYLSNNPEVANFQTGYQWIVGVVFLLVFPLSILLRTLACASSQVFLSERLGFKRRWAWERAKSVGVRISEEERRHPGWIPPVGRILSGAKSALGQISPLISRLWQVDLLVAVRSIPLQGLSLFLLPLPWTLPRLINLQLAAPIALFQGEQGDFAIKQSAKQIQPARKAFAFPFLGLLVTSKLLGFAGRMALVNLDPRITAEIPEIPIAIYVLIAVATLIIHRVQDLLPFVLYSELTATKDGKSQSLKPVTS